MAGEVVANAEKVVKWAWDGAQALQVLIDKHESRKTQVLDDAIDECRLMHSLHRRALAAAHVFTLTADEAEVMGSIAHRSFFEEWEADFEDEYGVAK